MVHSSLLGRSLLGPAACCSPTDGVDETLLLLRELRWRGPDGSQGVAFVARELNTQ